MSKPNEEDAIFSMDYDSYMKLLSLSSQMRGGTDRERDYGQKLFLILDKLEASYMTAPAVTKPDANETANEPANEPAPSLARLPESLVTVSTSFCYEDFCLRCVDKTYTLQYKHLSLWLLQKLAEVRKFHEDASDLEKVTDSSLEAVLSALLNGKTWLSFNSEACGAGASHFRISVKPFAPWIPTDSL